MFGYINNSAVGLIVEDQLVNIYMYTCQLMHWNNGSWRDDTTFLYSSWNKTGITQLSTGINRLVICRKKNFFSNRNKHKLNEEKLFRVK